MCGGSSAARSLVTKSKRGRRKARLSEVLWGLDVAYHVVTTYSLIGTGFFMWSINRSLAGRQSDCRFFYEGKRGHDIKSSMMS